MSGGGSNTTTTQASATSAPAWLQPYQQQYLSQAAQVASRPYEAYTGQRQAAMNGAQTNALEAVQQRAMNGSAEVNAGSGYLQNTLGGQAQQATQNPYGQISAGQNGQQFSPGQNAYAGSNPYLQQSIDNTMGDMARSYNLTTAPAMDRAMAQSGSFGNSGVQQMQMESQRQLGQQMGQTASAMRMQDYGTQQQLGEAALNRGLQAQQLQSGVTDNNLSRQFQAAQLNQSNGQNWASRNDAMAQQFMGQQMQAAQLAPTYGAQGYTDANALFNAGSLQQQQQQTGLDQQYQQWQQAQAYPQQQVANFGAAMGINAGNTTTQTTQAPGANPWATAAGLGLAGASIYYGQ